MEKGSISVRLQNDPMSANLKKCIHDSFALDNISVQHIITPEMYLTFGLLIEKRHIIQAQPVAPLKRGTIIETLRVAFSGSFFMPV